MKPYTANTRRGRLISRDDIHHKSRDVGTGAAKAKAKAQRHAARREGKRLAD